MIPLHFWSECFSDVTTVLKCPLLNFAGTAPVKKRLLLAGTEVAQSSPRGLRSYIYDLKIKAICNLCKRDKYSPCLAISTLPFQCVHDILKL
jgi:hypothetical protein